MIDEMARIRSHRPRRETDAVDQGPDVVVAEDFSVVLRRHQNAVLRLLAANSPRRADRTRESIVRHTWRNRDRRMVLELEEPARAAEAFAIARQRSHVGSDDADARSSIGGGASDPRNYRDRRSGRLPIAAAHARRRPSAQPSDGSDPCGRARPSP